MPGKKYIIFLPEVTLESLIELPSEEETDDEISQPETERTYDVMPKHFTSLEEWPGTLNVQCWNCGINMAEFQHRPLPIPHDLGKTFDVDGVVCSGSCGLAWIRTNDGNLSRWNDFKFVYRMFYPKENPDYFVDPPNKYQRECYGGPLSDVAYNNKFRELENSYSNVLTKLAGTKVAGATSGDNKQFA